MNLVVDVILNGVCVVVLVFCVDDEVVLIAYGPYMVIKVGADYDDAYVYDDDVLDLAVADSLANAVGAFEMIGFVHDNEIDVEVVVALIDDVAF